MGYFSFPHTRTYDSDLGWLIKHLKGIDEKLDEYLENSVITFADPIQWDITEQYTALTMVIDSDGTAYLSKQPVPAGVDISNTDYWMPIFNYDDNINDLRATIAANEEESTTASAPRVPGDLVYIQGVLYEVTADMPAGTAYVVGSNCKQITVSDRIAEIEDENVNDLDDLRATIAANEEESTTASAPRVPGDLVYLNGVLYEVIADMPAGMSYIEGSNCKQITVSDRIAEIGDDVATVSGNLATEVLDRQNADIIINNRINAILERYITPQDFGAVGNGVTDDTQAFKDMLNDSNKSIFIPDGTYYITDTLVVPDKTHMICNGTLLFADTVAVAVQLGGPTNNNINLMYVNGLSIDTATYNQNSVGFKVFGCVECTFISLRANNFGTNLLITPGDGRTAYNTFVNPVMTRGYYNIHISGGNTVGYHCNENLVVGGRCFWADGQTNRNILIDAGYNSDWIFLENCCEGINGEYGIECNAGSCSFYSCRLEGNWSGAGIKFGSDSQRCVIIAPRYDFTIEDLGTSNIYISNRAGNKLNGSTLCHATLHLTSEGGGSTSRYFLRADNTGTPDAITIDTRGEIKARALTLPYSNYNYESLHYGNIYFWIDALGYLRQKQNATPTAADDGEIVGCRFRQAAYTPVNVVGPRYIGEEFLNTATNTWYKACTMANTGWVALN